MDKNIIKEQEYVRIDEEPKAPKTITYEGENGGEKYVRCDTLENRITDLRETIVSILRNYPSVISFNPAIRQRITRGNIITFIVRDIEYSQEKAKGKLFRVFFDGKFHSEFVRRLRARQGVLGVFDFKKTDETSNGIEKYRILIDCALKTKPRGRVHRVK